VGELILKWIKNRAWGMAQAAALWTG